MPNEKVLESKKALVDRLSDQLKNSVAGVLVNYKGINVADDTTLRKKLREAGVEYFVVKNTLLRFAANNAGYSELSDVLEGTTALGLSAEDPVVTAKILAEYAKDAEGDFSIKAGFVDGKVLNADEVNELAKLPSKDVLVAKALGSLNAPISGLANVLNANLRGLVIALNQIAEKSA